MSASRKDKRPKGRSGAVLPRETAAIRPGEAETTRPASLNVDKLARKAKGQRSKFKRQYHKTTRGQ